MMNTDAQGRDKSRKIMVISREKKTPYFNRNLNKINDHRVKGSVDSVLKKIEIVSDGYKFFEAKIMLVIILVISCVFLLRESLNLYHSLNKYGRTKVNLVDQYKSLGGDIKQLEPYSKSNYFLASF